MGAKIAETQTGPRGGRIFVFFCPGCRYDHAFEVPPWTWNGSLEKPTFRNSLLVNQHHPASRCHSFVTDGRIRFLSDSFHALAGQDVELLDYET